MRPYARLLALLAALGVIAGAVSGCGSSDTASTTPSRAAQGSTDADWGIAAVTQAGRTGPVTIRRCTAGGDPACTELDGAQGPIRQLALESNGQSVGPLFAGTFNGDVLRCDPNRPTSCDAIDKVPGITAIAASAQGADDAEPSVYLGTTVGYEGANGDIWRCPQKTAAGKCTNVGRPVPGDFVASMTITDGSVFAGLQDGRVLRCTTGAPTSACTTFATPGGGIMALDFFRDTIGVATDEGAVWRCPTDETAPVTCTKVASIEGARATAVALFGEDTYAGFALAEPDARGLLGAVLFCAGGSDCTPVELPAPGADPQPGDPSAAPVTALVAASDNNLWVGQGTIDSRRSEGAITKCPYEGTCTTQWSDGAAGVTAMTEVPAQ